MKKVLKKHVSWLRSFGTKTRYLGQPCCGIDGIATELQKKCPGKNCRDDSFAPNTIKKPTNNHDCALRVQFRFFFFVPFARIYLPPTTTVMIITIITITNWLLSIFIVIVAAAGPPAAVEYKDPTVCVPGTVNFKNLQTNRNTRTFISNV